MRLNAVFVRLYAKLKRYENLQFKKLQDRHYQSQAMSVLMLHQVSVLQTFYVMISFTMEQWLKKGLNDGSK